MLIRVFGGLRPHRLNRAGIRNTNDRLVSICNSFDRVFYMGMLKMVDWSTLEISLENF